MIMDHESEYMALAVEIIRQLENLDYSVACILQAMIIVCEDTLNKLPPEQQETWQKKFEESLNKRVRPS